jgi:hypothetical protein
MTPKMTQKHERAVTKKPELVKSNAKRVPEKKTGQKKTSCKDCRAFTAFHSWRDQHLTPSFNWEIDFTNLIPNGKRAVIELVTAEINVPAGEWARLRLYTSLGAAPSNLDLFMVHQGTVGGHEILQATHSLRVYSDSTISFNVNRDNAVTEGDAFIGISGYLVDA